MTIPTFQEIMLPLLQLTNDDRSHSQKEVIEILAKTFKLTNEETTQLLNSGSPRFKNRVVWATIYLKKALLLSSIDKGIFRITQRGKEVLLQNPSKLDMKFLSQFAEFIEFRKKKKEKNIEDQEEIQTPEELLEKSYDEIRQKLSLELLEKIKQNTPLFFEKLVVELLVAMGYGGSIEDAGKALGRSGDEGIDGEIKQDKLGLETIYIQAKRWKDKNQVGRPEIQRFAGSLMGKGATKGVFITTSSFSDEAYQYAKNLKLQKLILIDGEELSELMIDHNIGVTELNNYVLKRIDNDYFEE